MNNLGVRDLKRFKRKALSVSQELLVKTDYLGHGGRTPLVIRPALEGVELVTWAASNRELIEDPCWITARCCCEALWCDRLRSSSSLSRPSRIISCSTTSGRRRAKVSAATSIRRQTIPPT